MKALLSTLTDAELGLVRECERDNIGAADEDTLIELHGRVRQARDKYVGMYRRQASARVAESGGRGKARPKNTLNAQKAEVFEDALARVSRQLATAARHSALELRADRLAAVREDRNTAPLAPRGSTASRRSAPAQKRAATRAPAGRATPGAGQAARKRQAASAAAGARQQASRDNR
ncbi:hypothetical protein [Actinoplanes lobatus]|nr:hypothetical protein [Actinoplanes lobatus]MBB4752497.1 hypothetical protein [Actinoplanes lobatus]